MPQGAGDLGQRMQRAIAAFQFRDVLLIGADIPGVDGPAIAEGFAALKGHDVVIGPATDGGYWLIGRRAGVRLDVIDLSGVRWSTSNAMSDTCQLLRPRFRVAFGPVLSDVDDAADLRS